MDGMTDAMDMNLGKLREMQPGMLQIMGSERAGHDWATEQQQQCICMCMCVYICVYMCMYVYVCLCICVSCLVVSDSLGPHGL